MPVENLSRKPGEHWMAIVRKMERSTARSMPRPDHHRMVGATATASYRVCEPGFSPLGDNHRVACNEQGRFRQWTAQLRGCASARRGLARLLALYARGARATASRAARSCRGKPQVPPFPDDGGIAQDRGQDRDEQRGILPSLSPSAGGHGCAAFADQRHGPYGVPACRRTPQRSTATRTRS
jgi:hypothetical protein